MVADHCLPIMPTKRKSNIGRSTRNAKQAREVRRHETEEQRRARLAHDRQHYAASRELETPTQRYMRLEAYRKRQVESRESETPTQRYKRLEADRKRHRKSRESETPMQRYMRLEADRERHAEYLISESPTQRYMRLEADRIRKRIGKSRASETPMQLDVQLVLDHNCKSHTANQRKYCNNCVSSVTAQKFIEMPLSEPIDAKTHAVSIIMHAENQDFKDVTIKEDPDGFTQDQPEPLPNFHTEPQQLSLKVDPNIQKHESNEDDLGDTKTLDAIK